MVNLVDTFSEFKMGKNIDRPTMVKVLEDVFRTLIKKRYGSDDNFDVIVNTTKGDLELWRVREIVPDGEVTDERSQIAISEALLIDEDYEVGEECYEQLELEDFGRRSIMRSPNAYVANYRAGKGRSAKTLLRTHWGNCDRRSQSGVETRVTYSGRCYGQ